MVHGKKIVSLVIGLLLIVSINCLAQSKKKASLEDRIIDTIFKLPEVQRRITYVEKQTHNKRHIQIGILSKPNKKEPFYIVQVMEDNGMTMYTHFNFYVYLKNDFLIKYLDTMHDDALLTLKQWRKSPDHPKE